MVKLISVFIGVLFYTALPLNAQHDTAIHWPNEYSPAQAKFFVHNEIEINAPAAVVWDILVHATDWPKWYKGAKNVRLLNTHDTVLKEASVFSWETMGLKFESTIKEFVPHERLSWESKKKSIQGYHAWLIVPTKTGCKLITDESQHGWLTFFEKLFQPKKLYKLHNVWLAEIKKKAEAAAQQKN